MIERPLPTALSSNSSSETELNKINTQMDNFDLSTDVLEISFQDLQEFDDSLTPEQRKKTPKKKKPKKSKTKKLKEQEDIRKKELIDILVKGDIDRIKELLEKETQNLNESETIDNIHNNFLNQIIDDNSNTLLHIAALNEQCDMLNFLLENNADPCLRNKNQHTAYTSTHSRNVREALKIFAKENPDKFNYNKVSFTVYTSSRH